MFKLGKEPINNMECKLVNITVSILVFNILSITASDDICKGICKGICKLTFLFPKNCIGISSFLKEGIVIRITLQPCLWSWVCVF